MQEIDIYIRATITILGLAYPILLQVIARLDEKYSSNHIVELFDKEKHKKWFRIFLVSSLISIFIWTFKLKPLFQINGLNYLVNNSANILVILNTTVLVVFFFLYVNKIIVYYTPAKFINYLIYKHNKNKADLIHFKALSDVFLLSLQKQNDNISQTISRFYYDSFKEVREKEISKPVVYPDAYYSLVYKAIEELAVLKNKNNSALEYRTSGGVWLLGEMQDCEISETTYSWLWRNILLAIEYERDNMILYHWEKAHQYFIYNLNYINNEYDHATLEVKNIIEVKKRDLERDRFLQFHFALGGLLLYKKRYSCIRRIFNYTTSEPSSYDLLPSNMNEIFSRYMEFRDRYNSKLKWISSIYGFPDQSGIKSDGVIRKWISSYLAILILRQYTIIPYLVTMKPLDFPVLPETQNEKKEWIDSLDFLKKLISEGINNFELITELNYNFLTREWSEKNGKLYPLDFIDKLKEALINKYEEDAIYQPLSNDKVQEFYKSTSNILKKTFNKFSKITNANKITIEYNSWFINGLRMIQRKDAFAKESEVHYHDYDTYLALSNSEQIKDGIASTFQINKTKSYLLKQENIFIAIEKLNINQNFIIITFGINLSYYIDFIKVKGLSNDNYKGIKLFSFSSSKITSPSFFIINKDGLPNIILGEIEAEVIHKYSLIKVNNDYNIFASVIDLNNATDEIKEEILEDFVGDDLKKSVLLNISHSTEIRWKKNVELIQLIEYSEYRQDGLPDNIDDFTQSI